MLSNWLTGSIWSAGSRLSIPLIALILIGCSTTQAVVVGDFCPVMDKIFGGQTRFADATKSALDMAYDMPGVARDVNNVAVLNENYKCLCEKRDCQE